MPVAGCHWRLVRQCERFRADEFAPPTAKANSIYTTIPFPSLLPILLGMSHHLPGRSRGWEDVIISWLWLICPLTIVLLQV